MIDQDELMKMARIFGQHGKGESIVTFDSAELADFACAILERAAVVAMLTADNGIVTSSAIRALKPKQEA